MHRTLKADCQEMKQWRWLDLDWPWVKLRTAYCKGSLCVKLYLRKRRLCITRPFLFSMYLTLSQSNIACKQNFLVGTFLCCSWCFLPSKMRNAHFNFFRVSRALLTDIQWACESSKCTACTGIKLCAQYPNSAERKSEQLHNTQHSLLVIWILTIDNPY